MSVFTESELREMWQNGRGQIPPFPPGTRFSAAAQDFLNAHHLDVHFEAAPSPPSSFPTTAEWDKPGTFPVVLTGPVPICAECGQPLPHKPEHMTQIDPGHFAPKTAPRLVMRGRVDSLHGMVMLTAAVARRFQLPELAGGLDTLAAYCREIMSAEYNLRPTAPLVMLGKSENELHEISHWPDRHLGMAHLVPGPQDHEILHWLNVLRTQAREVEIVALTAFPPGNLDPSGVGPSLTRALNRLSSAVYVLELYFQAGKLSWKGLG
jgi:ethanolamine utilization cobalamin adenosyltransferase